jgi:hypothetical protein
MGEILVLFVLLSLSSAMFLSNEKVVQFQPLKQKPQLITTPLQVDTLIV